MPALYAKKLSGLLFSASLPVMLGKELKLAVSFLARFLG